MAIFKQMLIICEGIFKLETGGKHQGVRIRSNISIRRVTKDNYKLNKTK